MKSPPGALLSYEIGEAGQEQWITCSECTPAARFRTRTRDTGYATTKNVTVKLRRTPRRPLAARFQMKNKRNKTRFRTRGSIGSMNGERVTRQG